MRRAQARRSRWPARWPSCRMIRIMAWAMGPWLQCTVLDESLTAQLQDWQPTLSAEACLVAHGDRRVQRDEEPRTAAAASAQSTVLGSCIATASMFRYISRTLALPFWKQ